VKSGSLELNTNIVLEMSSHTKPMFSKSVVTVWFLTALVFLATSGMAVQDNPPQDTSRKIVSDDFTKNRRKARPATSKGNDSKGQSSNQQVKPSRTYQLASPLAIGDLVSKDKVVAQLGITIWRLRPTNASDEGRRALIREKKISSKWVPERVEAESSFVEGDHVRLTIESPRDGYLYVINRDLFANGMTGSAILIYPWPGIDNQLVPGRLIDIPGQEDDPSYFTARLTNQDQLGELLTFIVTASPLNLPLSDDPIKISDEQMSRWTQLWGGPTERFELLGGAGEAWTQPEQLAAVKKGARQLTRDDPLPQTIYRVLTEGNQSILVNLQLRYRK
jgi:hypothetical protein